MRHVRALPAALALAALTACGGGGGEGPTGAVTFDDLVKRAKCASAEKYGDMFTAESGQCVLPDGTEVSLAGFDTRADRLAWVAMVEATGFAVEHGDHWAVSAENEDAMRAVAHAIRA